MLGRIFFNHWAKHACEGHDGCMRVLILDGELKASYAVCSLPRGVLGGERVYVPELEGFVEQGCREGCAYGARFCKEHENMLKIPGVAAPARSEHPDDCGGAGGGARTREKPAAPAPPARVRAGKVPGADERHPPCLLLTHMYTSGASRRHGSGRRGRPNT